LSTKKVVEIYSSDGYFESPDFSAAGKYIRFNGHDKLYQIPVTGGEPKALGPADFVFNHDRARSRDGRWEPLTSVNGNDNSDFSPDGRWIYFDSRRSGMSEIWRIPADGAGPEDSLVVVEPVGVRPSSIALFAEEGRCPRRVAIDVKRNHCRLRRKYRLFKTRFY